MQDYKKIPVKNIYYMLCYAWDRLREKDHININQEDDKDIYHLLTRVLLQSLNPLIKRGFYREYRYVAEETSTLRGKIQFQESINHVSFKRAKMFCEYDELSHDILHNQLIKSTLYILLQNEQIDLTLKEKIFTVYSSFEGISVINIHHKNFQDLRLHRSNQHYGFILEICKLIYDCLLINEETSSARFIDFERDHQAMANLFERFVFHFYRQECSCYTVKRDNIYWDAQGEDVSYLPRMQTDISLESEKQKIIIDTKYSHHALASNYDTEKVKSDNLYQLFAYLSNYKNNAGVHKQSKGILLYPKVYKALDLSFQIKDYPIKVCTVDLNEDWQDIHHRLLNIVNLK